MQPNYNVIQRLPEAVVQQSKANIHVSSFSVALADLVLNAVEAGSRSVQVNVSTKDWSATVADDGCGITTESMQLLGQRFCTSKPAPARGEALHCLAQVSSVHITSRAQGTFETFSKTLGSSSAASVQLCTTPRQRHGTTVTLTNFLQRQPVRRRHAKGHAAALEEVKTALHAVMLPYPAVELSLQQQGSSVAVLRMPKDRSLSSSCQQILLQEHDKLHCISTVHKQGWQLTGCVAAPPATFQSANQQLLYLNKHPITCKLLQQMLRDWFLRSLRGFQVNPDNHSSRNANLRAPEPGYVLLITCPASAAVLQVRTALHTDVDFGSSMSQLVQQLQEGISPAWGSVPPTWHAAAAPNDSNRSGGRPQSMYYTGGGGIGCGAPAEAAQVVAAGSGHQRNQPMQQLHAKQAQLQPVHGLQLASRTRSLAGRAADTSAVLQDDLVWRQPNNSATQQQLPHSHKQQEVGRNRCSAGVNDASDHRPLMESFDRSSGHEYSEAADPAPAAAAGITADAKWAAAKFSDVQGLLAKQQMADTSTTWVDRGNSPTQHAPGLVSTSCRHTAAASVAAAPAGYHSLSSPGLLDTGICSGDMLARTAAAVIAGSPAFSISDAFADDMGPGLCPPEQPRCHSKQQQQQHIAPQQLQYNSVSRNTPDLSPDSFGMSPFNRAVQASRLAHHSVAQHQREQHHWVQTANSSPSYSGMAAAATVQAVASVMLEDQYLPGSSMNADVRYDRMLPSLATGNYQLRCWGDGRMPQQQRQRQLFDEGNMLWEPWKQRSSMECDIISPVMADENCLQSALQQAPSPGQSPFVVSPLVGLKPHMVYEFDSTGTLEQQQHQEQRDSLLSPTMTVDNDQQSVKQQAPSPSPSPFGISPLDNTARKVFVLDNPLESCDLIQNEQQRRHHQRQFASHCLMRQQQQHEDVDLLCSRQQAETKGTTLMWDLDERPQTISAVGEWQQQPLDDHEHSRTWQHQHDQQLLQQQQQAEDLCRQQPHMQVHVGYNTAHVDLLQHNEQQELEELLLQPCSKEESTQQQQQQHKLSMVAASAAAGSTEGDLGELGTAAVHTQTTVPQKHRGSKEDHWHPQCQPERGVSRNAAGLSAAQLLHMEALLGLDADGTSMRFAVCSRIPSFGPSPVVSRRQDIASGADARACSFQGGVQQLLASSLNAQHDAAGGAQAAMGRGVGAHAAAAAQESVGSVLLDEQAGRCWKGRDAFGHHKPAYDNGLLLRCEEQREQQQQQHETPRTAGPALSKETVLQGQEVNQISLLGRPAGKDIQQQIGKQRYALSQRKRWQQQSVGADAARATAGSAAAVLPAAPLLQPFHQRLLRSASPRCKRQRRFAVSVLLAAADRTHIRHHVREQLLQLPDKIDRSAACNAVAGGSSRHSYRPPASTTQPVAGPEVTAAAPEMSESGGPATQQQLQQLKRASGATGSEQQVDKRQRPALRDVSNTAPQAARTAVTVLDESNWSKAGAISKTSSTAAAQPAPAAAPAALAARKDAVPSRHAADGGSGSAPTAAWKQMQEQWQHQQLSSKGQKRKQLCADKPGLQDPPDKQLYQSKLPFLPLSSMKPAATTVDAAGSAAEVEVPQGDAHQQTQTAGTAAAAPLAADNMADISVATTVAAAPQGAASAPATKLRSSLSKPRMLTAEQQPKLLQIGDETPQVARLLKCVRFSDKPNSSSVEELLQCAAGRQQCQPGAPEQSTSGGPAAAGQSLQTTAAAAPEAAPVMPGKKAAPGARTSPFFSGVKQHQGPSSNTDRHSIIAPVVDCIAAAAAAGYLFGSHDAAGKSMAPPILSVDDLCSSSSSSSTALVPGSVTRQQLQKAHTLAQVENKIVLVRCNSVLLAIDQHAADERVQLEALQHHVALQLRQQGTAQQQNPAVVPPPALVSTCQTNTGQAASVTYSSKTSGLPGAATQPRLLLDSGGLLQQRKLNPGVPMLLSMAEARSLVQHRQQVEAWGWKVVLHDSSTGAAAGQSTGVTTAASLQQAPVLCGVQLGALDVQMYLHQLLETGGSAQQPPPGVVRTLKSKACRSAIMFGTALKQQQCVKLVQQLGATQLCFCCAHGRPTTAPLVDLVAVAARMEQQLTARSLGQAAIRSAAEQGSHGQPAMQQLHHRVRKLVYCKRL